MNNSQNKGVLCISVDVLENIIKNTVRKHTTAGPVGIQILTEGIFNSIKNTNNAYVINDIGICNIVDKLVSTVEEALTQNYSSIRIPVTKHSSLLGFTFKTISDIILASYSDVSGTDKKEDKDSVESPVPVEVTPFYINHLNDRVTNMESIVGTHGIEIVQLKLKTEGILAELSSLQNKEQPKQPILTDIKWNPRSVPLTTTPINTPISPETETEKQKSTLTQEDFDKVVKYTVGLLDEKVKLLQEKITALEENVKVRKSTTKPKAVTPRKQMFSNHVGQKLEITDKPQEKVKTSRPDRAVTRP